LGDGRADRVQGNDLELGHEERGEKHCDDNKGGADDEHQVRKRFSGHERWFSLTSYGFLVQNLAGLKMRVSRIKYYPGMTADKSLPNTPDLGNSGLLGEKTVGVREIEAPGKSVPEFRPP